MAMTKTNVQQQMHTHGMWRNVMTT
jgi:hypothetical protein